MSIEDDAWRFVERTRRDFEGILAKHCSREEAQDAVCDAAIRLVKHAHRSDPEKWAELFKQACFSAMTDNIRKVKGRVKVIDGKTYGSHRSIVKPDISMVAQDAGYGAVEFCGVVASIPDPITRKCFTLRMKGMKFSEIGRELGITTIAAKCRVHSVRKEMEKSL